MDDLLEQMQQVLGTEEGQQQLKQVMDLFGGDNGQMPDLSALFSGSSDTTANTAQEESPQSPSFSLDPTMLLMIQQMMGSFQKDDDNTRLLLALKPHFRVERQEKIDRAVQLLRLMALWPLIKDSGLLGGLLHGK